MRTGGHGANAILESPAPGRRPEPTAASRGRGKRRILPCPLVRSGRVARSGTAPAAGGWTPVPLFCDHRTRSGRRAARRSGSAGAAVEHRAGRPADDGHAAGPPRRGVRTHGEVAASGTDRRERERARGLRRDRARDRATCRRRASRAVADPDAAAERIAREAARKAAVLSGSLALPPGPLGHADGAARPLPHLEGRSGRWSPTSSRCTGAPPSCTRTHMLYCLFRHLASQVVRDVVVRAGPARRRPAAVVRRAEGRARPRSASA